MYVDFRAVFKVLSPLSFRSKFMLPRFSRKYLLKTIRGSVYYSTVQLPKNEGKKSLTIPSFSSG